MNTSNLTITRKRGGWIVREKATRKQVNQGILRLRKDALEFIDNLMNKESQIKPSNLLFKSEFKKFADERWDIAGDPTLQLTFGGAQGYRSDWNKRIEPLFDDCLLSDFKYDQMSSFIIKCHRAGSNFKTLQRMVRNIKAFLNVMKERGSNPCLDMLKYDITKQWEVVPTDHEDRYEKQTTIIDEKQLGDMILDLQKSKDKDFKSAYKFALISTLFLFGLRRGEIKGRKIKDVDFDNSIISINSVYIQKEGGLLKRTKNKGSFRNIDVDENGLLFFNWWINTVKKYKSNSDWLYPSFRGEAPISDSGFSNLMWQTLSDYGFAKIHFHKGHVVVDESPFKNAVSKMFRHRLGTTLIDAMDYEKLSRNYIKKTLGHTRFSTSQDRYGNHNTVVAKSTTATKGKLLNSKLIS
tara:strand:- start:3384 stop:4610 length:1227 start_codon:yes stop_codon:yes gene_type:complete